MSLSCMKTVFLFFTVVVILFSFSTVAFAASTPDVENTVPWDINLLLVGIQQLLSNFGNFLFGLFIPSENFFPNQLQRLNDLITDKMGGFGHLFKTLKDFWNGLGSGVQNISFSIPNNYFFNGYKGITINPLSHSASYINIFRDVFSVFMAIITSIACYKKLITFFSD